MDFMAVYSFVSDVNVVGAKKGPQLRVEFKPEACQRQRTAAILALAAQVQLAFVDDEFDVRFDANTVSVSNEDWSYESDYERVAHAMLCIAREFPLGVATSMTPIIGVRSDTRNPRA